MKGTKNDEKENSYEKWIILLAAIVILVSSSIPAMAASKPKINKKSASIYVGKTVKLKVTGTNKKIKWSSSNKSIATVSKSGKVKGKKAGSVKITAKVGKKKYTCKVTVKTKPTTSKKPATQQEQPALNIYPVTSTIINIDKKNRSKT